ncbi:hypothetical protein D9615_008127 [Tricholomella constricta]|uniref:Uncharacterized protein n=1 Tax=Tricholomella constricta TaxID=117010 RepID=A0A8H5GVJ3_9AGAR|nr:hypothetical protein D9615_008127 [Tricholomella constricta]
MTRIPSSLPRDSPDYRGPILINPGGPGGSGIDTVTLEGRLLSQIVGPQFDVLGFDPRGVGRSTPRASFFETAVERELFGGHDGVRESLSVLNTSADGLARAWARAKIVGQLAGERQREVLAHINTDQTANDMLSIVRAHGKEKLLYWGFSYGSVLGATFASMFPDKVERIVIDGVVDIENYYQSLWSTNLIDTDKAMDAFFTFCHAAGPFACPFYAPTPDLISANLTKLYESVTARPVPVRTATSYGLVDYNRLRVSVFISLYTPWATWSKLAGALADLARGDGAPLFSILDGAPFQCECDEGEEGFGVVRDAATAILCNDGDPVPEAFEELEKYFEETTKKSQWAEIWSGVRTSCVGWPELPKTRFRGPFEGNTSFPLLVVGNTADPVTPLWAAKKTAKGFPSSVVLTQDSPGHCSISAPSVCTQMYIRDYFVKGTLPPPGTVCSVVGTPFPGVDISYASNTEQITLGNKEVEQQVAEMSAEERVVYDAIRKLSESYNLPRML